MIQAYASNTSQGKKESDDERRSRAAKLKAIEITTNRIVNDTLAGQYHSVFKGHGVEFDQVRLYTPGDDVRAIDWNVTARANEAYVRQYHEERELSVMLMVDCSASGRFGTRDQTKVELEAELSALLAFSAIRNNDKVGLILFTDRVEKVILPKKGRKHVLRVVNDILSYKPEHKGTNIGEAFVYLSRLKIRRSVVFLISDLLDNNFEDGLKVVSRKHDLVCINIRDKAEHKLPDLGLLPMEDPETGDLHFVDLSDERVRRELFESLKKFNDETDQLLSRHKVEQIKLFCGMDYVPMLVAFFRRRAKRM